MAQASEQKLWPSRKTAWDACTSQVQREQAQGVAGAITTNQLTVVWAEKKSPQNKHTISKHNLCGNIDNDSHPRQDARPATWKPESIKNLDN